MLQIPAILTTAPAGQRRSTCHELRGRLGLREERAPSDLRERILWVIRQLKYDASARALFSAIQDLETRDRVYCREVKVWSGPERKRFRDPPRPPDTYEWLPRTGVHHRVEPYLLWIGKQCDNLIDERPPPGNSEFFQQRYLSNNYHIYIGDVSRFMGEILDWAEAEHVNLYDYDFDQALAASCEWHRQFSVGVGFRSTVAPAVVLATWEDGGHIDRLVTRRHLADEGTSMGHCVGGRLDRRGIAPGDGQYWQQVRDDKSIIVSYRGPSDMPYATVEITRSTDAGDNSLRLYISQVQGPEDEEIEDKTARARMLWFLVRMMGPHILSDRRVVNRLVHDRDPSFDPTAIIDDIHTTLWDLDEEILGTFRSAEDACWKIISQAVDTFERGKDTEETTAQINIALDEALAPPKKAADQFLSVLERAFSDTTSPLHRAEDGCVTFKTHLGTKIELRYVEMLFFRSVPDDEQLQSLIEGARKAGRDPGNCFIGWAVTVWTISGPRTDYKHSRLFTTSFFDSIHHKRNTVSAEDDPADHVPEDVQFRFSGPSAELG
jgi:hypothetical protein